MIENLKQIKTRSVYSVGSLLAQSSYSALLGFLAFFILSLKSGVYLLGIYNTVLAFISFFNYLTNMGLAAAIVQKKDVDEKDLNTAFFIQFFLTLIVVILGFLLTGYLFKFYKDLPSQAAYLYWSLLFSFFLLSLKMIPSVLLEKKIKIYKVVLVQAVENTVFYVCVIVFIILGFEIYSLIIAILVRSVIGTALIYFLNPWTPRLSFSFQSARSLLSYGIPFQGNSFLAMIKDDLLIIYLGSAIGLSNLGIVSFAKKYAEFSIRLIMDNINRVAFPLFSKVQNNTDLLKKSLERVLFYESLLILPIIIGTLFVFDSLLKLVPGYFAKWHNSLFSFYFFSASAFFVSLTTPFINLFNAIGRVRLSLYFMVLWTILTWALVPVFIQLFGFNGISIAFFIQSLTFVFVFIKAKKIVEFSAAAVFKNIFFGCCIMFIYLLIVRFISLTILHSTTSHLVFSFIGAPLIYFSILISLQGIKFIKEVSNSLV